MGFKSSCLVFLFFLSLSLSSALDMSIISYDLSHSQTPPLRTELEMMEMYEKWLVTHKKAYNGVGEKERRFEIFKDNLRFVDEHNSVDRTYKVGMNVFADLTNAEYRSKFLGSNMPMQNSSQTSNRYAHRVRDNLPASIDWRAKGAVLPVKDQGQCGSCWAFATAASIESLNQIVTGGLVSLSVQELVDCDRAKNMGCNGGWIHLAMEFIIKNGGIDSELGYPYKAVQNACDQNKLSSRVITINGYGLVPQNDEQSLKKAVASQPIVILIEAGGQAFQLYKSGVFNGACGTALDHAVVAVGYGSENGKDYWIVRNSWSPWWGEGGYIRMQRNVLPYGKCGLAMWPYYPTKTCNSVPKY